MESKIIDVATLFVKLVLEYGGWGTVEKLADAEAKILFDIVSAAGFEPRAVVPGKLRGSYRDQDGSATGETYPINQVCPYKVVDQEGRDDYLATGWLDQAFLLVTSNAREKRDHQGLAQIVATEIERSVPLAPVQLTAEGDMLREYPPSLNWSYFVEHSRDGSALSTCVGVHKYCNGWMDRNRATATDDAISCRSCHLRVLFPRGIKTYGELRSVLTSRWAQAA